MPEQEHIDRIDLRSDEVQEVLNHIPSWIIRWGNVVILILIIIFLFLSWMIKYPDVIIAKTLITTQIPPQKEYAKINGKIEALLIKNEQIVSKNTPIAVIENTASYKNVLLLKSIIDTIKINTNSFEFPLEELPVLFLGEIEVDFALFENNYSEYILNNKLEPFSNEITANKVSLLELYTRLENFNAQKRIGETEIMLKEKKFQRIKSLLEKGVISVQNYEKEKVNNLEAKRNYRNINLQISTIKEQIANSTKRSKSTEINRTKKDINLLNNTLQSFDQLKTSLKNWESKYVLKSNIDGRVSYLNYWTKNQTVTKGDLVLTIIPLEKSNYLAKIKAPTKNSGKIKIGQTVNIKLENFPDNEFGMLMGVVKHISLLPNKDGFYLIDVDLPKKLITTYNKEIPFKQEMIGTAHIITEDLRLIERLFYQFKNILNK